MEVNQDQVILEAEVVLEDTEDQAGAEDTEDPETTEEEVKKVPTIKKVETATADVADGKTVKLKEHNFVNYSKVKQCIKDLFY